MLDPATLDLPTLASLAGNALGEQLLADLREQGHPSLRTSHGYVFQHLVERSPTIGELAERLGVTQQAASKAVAELEGLGYVARAADPADSRVRRVSLTARGWDAVERARAARGAREAALVAALGEADVAAARRVLLAALAQAGGVAAVAARRARAPS